MQHHLYDKQKEKLLELIDQQRFCMLQVAEEYGLESVQTLDISQKLDQLIIQYQKISKLKKQFLMDSPEPTLQQKNHML